MLTSLNRSRPLRPLYISVGVAFVFCGLLQSIQAQAPEERVYLKYHGYISDAPEELTQLSCEFRFTPLDQPDDALYQELQSTLSVEAGRFTTTLGAQEEPLLAAYFRDPVTLMVSCDLDGDGEAELSVTEPIGQAPVSARALSASTVDRVEAGAVYVGDSPLFGVDGAWLGAPMIPEHQGVPLIDGDGRWVGSVSAPSANIELLSAGQALADSLYATELTSDSSSTATHQLSELYLRATDESSSPTLLIDEQGTWSGGLNVESGRIGTLDVDLLRAPSYASESGDLLIDELGRWVGPLPDGDRDADGFSDIQELALGSNPLDGDERPLDRDEDGQPDALQESTSLADTVFTTVQGTSSVTTTETLPSSPVTDWTLAKVTLEAPPNATLSALEVTLALSYKDTEGNALPFDSLTIHLIHNERALTLHNQTETLAGRYPEAERTPEEWPIEGISPQGEWSLQVTDSATPPGELSLNELTLTASYHVTGEALVNQTLNLGGTQRLTNVPEPSQPTEVATKRYVDERISYPSQLTYRHKTLSPINPTVEATIGVEASRALFGGLSASEWASGPLASQLDPNQLTPLLTEVAQAGDSATLVSTVDIATQVFGISSDLFVAHFEVENLTEGDISWPLSLLMTCGTLPSSLALNGVTQWQTTTTVDNDTPCTSGLRSDNVNLSLPPAQVSSLVLIARPDTVGRLLVALLNGSASLPRGLRYRARWRN